MVETLIFLIIVGILSSIFGKGKVRKTKGKSFLANGFEDFKTLIQQPIEHTPTVKHEVSKPSEKMEETIKVEYHQVREKIEKENNLIQTEPILNMPIMDAKNHLSQDEKEINLEDSNTILNGLIWSEILGEPRSRKPHFPRK